MRRASTKREKWAAAVLGAVCLALLINVLRSPYVGGGLSQRVSPRVQSRSRSATPPPPAAVLPSDEPEVGLDLLSQLNLRPLPPMDRNPFVYGPTPAEIQQQKEQTEKRNQPPPPPPPPPPPITVKALGFEEAQGGVRDAFFTDEDTPEAPGQTYEAREGQSFANRYKVLKITSMAVTIEDQSSHVTAQLPFPE